MDLGDILWFLGILAEILVVVLLMRRGVWRILKIFTLYCAWDLANNCLVLPLARHSESAYRQVYLALVIIDTVFVFAVLTELSWSVLRPIHKFLPRHSYMFIALLVVLAGVLVWPLTAVAGLGKTSALIFHVQQLSSLLRILFFLGLAACSNFLSLGWHDRELQVATGLGFYSLASFAAMLIHTHQAGFGQYTLMNEFVVASYLISLIYWVYSFAQKEAERREFTPQMQDLLLAMAGVAREQRLALAQANLERRQAKG
jgi:hypothetical protein